jgi:hypothetical protein
MKAKSSFCEGVDSDGLVINKKVATNVMPAKAGIQECRVAARALDRWLSPS